MILCKESVRFSCLRIEIWSLFNWLTQIFADRGLKCIITCGTDGHGSDDPHTNGFAIDVRSKHLNNPEVKEDVLYEMKDRFGPSYTVLLENPGQSNEHYHIQIRKDLWRTLL